jgi:hypothetical protein
MNQVYGRGDLPSTEIEVLRYPVVAGYYCYGMFLAFEWIKREDFSATLIDLLTILFSIY